MESKTVIEIIRHSEKAPGSKFHIAKRIEHIVTVDGEEVYRCATTPRKWGRDTGALRNFERWLCDEEAINRKKKSFRAGISSFSLSFALFERLSQSIKRFSKLPAVCRWLLYRPFSVYVRLRIYCLRKRFYKM